MYFQFIYCQIKIYFHFIYCQMKLFTFHQYSHEMIFCFQGAEYFYQIVDGLLHLHQHHKIMHRDLKLHNLLLSSDNKIRIADFGLATHSRPNDKHMTMCGTPHYIRWEYSSIKILIPFNKQYWLCGHSSLHQVGIFFHTNINTIQ